MIATLRRIPAPLLVAALGTIASGVFDLLHDSAAFPGEPHSYDTLVLGSWFAAHVFTAVGLAWLARGLSGAARVGAWVASAAVIASLVLRLAFIAYIFLTYSLDADDQGRETAVRVYGLAGSVLAVATLAGLGVATRRWYWIAVGVVLAFVAHPPAFVQALLLEWLGGDIAARFTMSALATLMWGATLLAMSSLACRRFEPSEAPVEVGRELARVRFALYGIAATTAVIAGCAVAQSAEHTYAALPLVILVTTTIRLVCTAGLGIAIVAVARGPSALPRWLVVASAALALSVAGELVWSVANCAQEYLALFPGGHHARLDVPGRFSLLPGLSAQLLASCAVGCLLVAIALAARRRALDALRGHAMAMTGAFAVLALGALTAQHLFANVFDLTSFDATVVIASTAALVASLLVAAVVVARGAEALGGGAQLPAAKLVRG